MHLPPGETRYECTVKTGLVEGASADVFASLTIYGKNGDSGPRHLKHLPRDEKVRMEAGGDGDLFHITAINLGQLTKVVINLDRQSWNVKWFLDSIEVDVFANERTLDQLLRWHKFRTTYYQHIIILRHLYNLPLKWCVFLPDVCLLRSRQHRQSLLTFLRVKFFNQIVANLPLNATEIIRFLKTNKIWVWKK